MPNQGQTMREREVYSKARLEEGDNMSGASQREFKAIFLMARKEANEKGPN